MVVMCCVVGTEFRGLVFLIVDGMCQWEGRWRPEIRSGVVATNGSRMDGWCLLSVPGGSTIDMMAKIL